MGEAPEPPRQRAAQLDPGEVDDGAPLADGRKVSGVLIAERGRRGLAAEPRPDHRRHICAVLLGGRSDARNRPSVRTGDDRGVADRKDPRQAAEACLQIQGGFGFAEEYDVERNFR